MVDQAHSPGQDAGSGAAPPGTPGRVRELFRRTIVQQGRTGAFLISASFLLSTLAVRTVTHSIRDQRFTFFFRNLSSGTSLHIHHCVFGILGLLGVGYTEVRFQPEEPRVRGTLAVLYGIAAALTLDEFALWLRLRDVYWTPEGRESVDALIVGGAWSLLALEGLSFWQALWRDTIWLLFRRGRPLPKVAAPANPPRG